MSGGHGNQGLVLHGHGLLYRLAPECKIATGLLFVVFVVLTPATVPIAFALYAMLLFPAFAWGRVPARALRRLVVVLPFLTFAFALPFLAGGPRLEASFVSVSRDGLEAGFNILVKAVLGATTSIILTSTTPMPDLIRGLERLRIPRVFTVIAGFMVRYADVITGEMRRMSIARASRGYAARGVWHARETAAGLATLFVRSYERGERVHLAMTARGYVGEMPVLSARRSAAPREWIGMGAFVVAAGAILLWSRLTLG